jgi:hypothetical protein
MPQSLPPAVKMGIALAGVAIAAGVATYLIGSGAEAPGDQPLEPAPIVTEVMLVPRDDDTSGPCQTPSPWIELFNPRESAVNLESVVLRTTEHSEWRFPAGAPLPPGEFVLVCYDGAPPEHETGGTGIFHAPNRLAPPANGLLSVWERTESDQEGDLRLVSFAAWGEPAPHEPSELAAGTIWRPGGFIPLTENFGYYEPRAQLEAGWSFGVYPGSRANVPGNWVLYAHHEVTPRRDNRIPSVKLFTPSDGAVVRSEDVSIGWRRRHEDEMYTFTLFERDGETVREVQEGLRRPLFRPKNILPPGRYYYEVQTRVQGQSYGSSSDGSPKWSIVSSALCCESSSVFHSTKMRHEFQRKDTRLLCLGGCGPGLWGSPHDLGGCLKDGVHGSQNCGRASISMLVSFYGGACLSQDYIAFANGEDLAHETTMGLTDVKQAFKWALNVSTLTSNPLDPDQPAYVQVVSDFGATVDSATCLGYVQTWLKEQRPIMALIKGNHVVVVNGSCTDTTSSTSNAFVHVLDPQRLPAWQRFPGWWADVNAFLVGPKNAKPREDPPSMWRDTDGDGIVDFDEEKRFDCHMDQWDTDKDGVPDKNDIREYVFQMINNPATGAPEEVYAARNPDFDGDSFPKENDSDNDNDGCKDGEEDENGNGRRDPGERNNFNPNDCPFFGLLSCTNP